ncbi:MAG: MBL fold metallo-hydrolase [Defluviitaleaceae bacterium]|nr:MBL fold metallo-hydrolase [Defluviitaleaceae bacterium]MCL2239919.1 MBL fold metallo-hydrolase [Defluviitaleaceae bacterium]
MKLKTFNNNVMGQNVYLYYDEASGEGVLIDAGCGKEDTKALPLFLKENNITVKAILLTHGHYDHIIGIDAIKEATGAPVYAHPLEKEMLEEPALNMSARMGRGAAVTPEHLLNDGDEVRVGDISLQVLHTPGHTPGGLCFYDEEYGALFTGDTLFKDSIGRTDFPSGSHEELLENIHKKILTLPSQIKIYPGHGSETSVGHEKTHNPFLQ